MFEKFGEILGGEKAAESSKSTPGLEDELFTLIKKREELMSNKSEGLSEEARYKALLDLTKRIERLNEKGQGGKIGHPST